MAGLDRRRFLGTSLGGVAAALSFGQLLQAQQEAPPEAAANGPATTPDGLFLSWQRDPTSTMTVQWIGPDAGADTIEYCGLAGEPRQSQGTTLLPFPDTDLKVHRCELSGLTPGSEYQFRINKGATTYRFRTMPAKSTNTIQFVSGGDCGTDDPAMATNVSAARQEPYFALLGGDLAYDNGESPETFLTFLKNYSRQMIDPVGRLIPMVSCIGNHETNDKSGPAGVCAPHYLSVFDGFFRDSTYGVLDIGD